MRPQQYHYGIGLFSILICALPSFAQAQTMSEDDAIAVNQSIDDYLNHNVLSTLSTVQSVAALNPPSTNCAQASPQIVHSDIGVTERPVEVNFLGGNLLGGKPGSKQDKTYELSFGQQVYGNAGVEVINLNEGDPINNHRDGFAVEGTYLFKLTPKLRAEVGAGPYLTMNTTTANGQESDVKRFGALASASLLYEIFPGFSGQVRLNYVRVPNEPSSVLVMAGVQGRFVGKAADGSSYDPKHLEVSVLGGYAHVNRQGYNTFLGKQLEVTADTGNNVAYSTTIIQDGPHNEAVGGQVWWVRPLNANWKVKGGLGAVADINETGTGGVKPAALFSLDVSRKIFKNCSLGARFTRKVTTTNHDEDNFFLEGSCSM